VAWRAGLSVVVLALLAMQLVRPEAPRAALPGDGTLADHVNVPAAVDSLLRAACSDCHSNETHWPWYAHIAPVSWLIAYDVRHGRSDLDFSSWSTDPVREPTPTQRLTWMCDNVRDGTMPPLLYRLMHPKARLRDEDKGMLCAWTEAAVAATRGR